MTSSSLWRREAPLGVFAPFAKISMERYPAPVFSRFPDIMGGTEALLSIRRQMYDRPLVRFLVPDVPRRAPSLSSGPDDTFSYHIDFERNQYAVSGETFFVVSFHSPSDQITFEERLAALKEDLRENGPFKMPF